MGTFNPFFTTSNAIIQSRLSRLETQLRGLSLSTREAYASVVYSSLNKIINLGSNMQPLATVQRYGPAKIGDIENNLTSLNNDAIDVAAELISLENQLADIYNLIATSQNTLRQQIREFIYSSTPIQFTEDFISSKQLDGNNSTVNIDYDAGLATCPVANQQTIRPSSIVLGPNSIGTVSTTQGVSNLLDNSLTTSMVFNGSQVEIQLFFTQPQIINRLTISQSNYSSLLITSLYSSPDGVYSENILNEILSSKTSLDASSNKFSGDYTIDFTPKNVSQLSIVLKDLTDSGTITLQAINTLQISYSSTGQVQTLPIYGPIGNVEFSTIEESVPPLTTITHLLSYDGIGFQGIIPGILSITSSPFWYRAVLKQNTAAFRAASNPLATQGDPAFSSNYTLGQITTVDLGNNLLARSINLLTITGSIQLQETPLPNTLVILSGATVISPTNYVFANNNITFNSPMSNVTINYQISALGTASIEALATYYSPLLYQVQFTQV